MLSRIQRTLILAICLTSVLFADDGIIHANERVEQILRRTLAKYLSSCNLTETSRTSASLQSTAEPNSCPLFVLSRHGCGRATAYSEFNKIVTIGTKTHVAWLDSQLGQFVVRIRTLDRNTGKWSPVYTVGQAHDNHGGPSLTCDSSGFLHIVYYPHHHPFRYRRSVRPNDASEWTKEVQFGKSCTYSSLICLPDDTLILTCRESTKKRWRLNLYEKQPNENWKGPQTILHGSAPSGYTRWQSALALGWDGKTIHMSFMLFETQLGEIGYAIGYLRSRDSGRTWERSDGEQVSLPATPKEIEIVDGSATAKGPMNFRPGNIALDPNGTPWLIYSRIDRQPFDAWIAHQTTKGDWRKISLLPAIQQKWKIRGVKTPASIVFGQDGTMYVAVTTVQSDIDDQTATWGHPSAEVALLVSKDYGRTFKVFGISPPDASVPNWLPNLERPTKGQPITIPSLIYTHGHKGKTNKEIMSNEAIWCDVAALLKSHTQIN